MLHTPIKAGCIHASIARLRGRAESKMYSRWTSLMLMVGVLSALYARVSPFYIPPVSSSQAPPVSSSQAPPVSSSQAPPVSSSQAPPVSSSKAPPVSSSQAPCDHPLRALVPSLFTHCATTCIYSDWTPWQTIQTYIPTDKTTCASEYYYVQQQTRTIVLAVGDRADCNEVYQTKKFCEFILRSIPGRDLWL